MGEISINQTTTGTNSVNDTWDIAVCIIAGEGLYEELLLLILLPILFIENKVFNELFMLCIFFFTQSGHNEYHIFEHQVQGSHWSLFPGKVLTFDYGSLGTGKVLSFNYFCQKVQEKSFFADWEMNVLLSDIIGSVFRAVCVLG